MLYIFEMANNHMGSVDHAKRIVDEFADLAQKKGINAGIKMQFRNLSTFIHPDFQQRNDLKYVKRFNETRLSKEQFKEIVNYIKQKGLLAITTPFDNESIPLSDDLNIDVLKVASCSVDDWPLLEDVSKINKKIIISTAGVELPTLRKVYKLFKQRARDFSFMHCVGEYPTPNNVANLDRIKRLKQEFPDIEIGFSTHESPLSPSVTPYAVAMGCTIVEKHIGVPTTNWPLNAYSLTKDQMETVITEIDALIEASTGKSTAQVNALKSLKRGVYLKGDLSKGHAITKDDLYFAMPVQENMFDASAYHQIIGACLTNDKKKNEGLLEKDIIDVDRKEILDRIKKQVIQQLQSAKVTVTENDDVEISAHFGLDNFFETGCVIVSKINRQYCKKILVMLPNQAHPTHRHMIKEESFELLSGDCELVLNGKKIDLQLGDPKLINTKVDHSFSSKNGCVIEEVSTTHFPGDSIYQNPKINKLTLEERKIKFSL